MYSVGERGFGWASLHPEHTACQSSPIYLQDWSQSSFIGLRLALPFKVLFSCFTCSRFSAHSVSFSLSLLLCFFFSLLSLPAQLNGGHNRLFFLGHFVWFIFFLLPCNSCECPVASQQFRIGLRFVRIAVCTSWNGEYNSLNKFEQVLRNNRFGLPVDAVHGRAVPFECIRMWSDCGDRVLPEFAACFGDSAVSTELPFSSPPR